jgi:DNA-binding NarL/FixJ family response regulator
VNVRVVADDLIWRSRLVAAVERAGATPVTGGGEQPAPLAVVDLNGRGYDGIAAVTAAAAAGATVIAVAQHEDLETRKRALTAGARRVFSYQKMYSDGPQVIADLLAGRFAAPDAPVETRA